MQRGQITVYQMTTGEGFAASRLILPLSIATDETIPADRFSFHTAVLPVF